MSMLGKMLGLGRNEDYDRAIRLFDQGLYEEAVACFGKARAHNGKDALTDRLAQFYTAEAHSNLGQSALKRGAWERAENHFRAALAINPHYADLHFNLALALRRRLRYDEALEALDSALKINPRFAKAHFQRGLVLYASGQRNDGIASICAAVEIEPGFDTDSFKRGIEAHEAGDPAAALYALEMDSATEVDDIQFYYHLGDDLYRRGMYAEAVDEYRKALELNPNYADVWNHMGLTFAAASQYEDALKAYDQAISINPEFTEVWVNKGIALREMGRLADSADVLRKVLAMDPENLAVQENLHTTEQAMAA